MRHDILLIDGGSSRYIVTCTIMEDEQPAKTKTNKGDIFSLGREGETSYKFIGNSGLRVSNICLGTMTFGQTPGCRPGQCNEEDSHKILDRFVELGGNFIDTADVYASGKSEEIVGTWLKRQDRERFVIATKCCASTDPTDPNAVGLSRKHILHSIDKSLKRLQTDFIDLYQMHLWDNAAPIEETLLALNDLVRAGKISYIGASNCTGWQMQKIVDTCKHMGLEKVISLQQQYSLVTRETEFELIDVCRNEGIGILPWSPLKGGWLTGKFKRGASLDPKSRIGWTNEDPSTRAMQSHPNLNDLDTERVWNTIDALEKISKETDKTVAQVSIRWLLQRPTVSSVVIGAKTIDQLEDNMGAQSGWELSNEQMESLSSASNVPLPYPYNLIFRRNMNRKPLGP